MEEYSEGEHVYVVHRDMNGTITCIEKFTDFKPEVLLFYRYGYNDHTMLEYIVPESNFDEIQNKSINESTYTWYIIGYKKRIDETLEEILEKIKANCYCKTE